MLIARAAIVLAIASVTAASALADPLTPDEFRRDLVGVPLCGTPASGPFAGKMLCTVHLPDGNAVLAGPGLLVRGAWEIAEGKVCRRNADDPLDRKRCVTYEKLGPDRYRNSDGVEFCLGPCPAP